MAQIKAVVAGAAGRMGRTVISVLSESDQIRVAGALDSESCESLGRDSGENAGVARNGIAITADPVALIASADAVIDFTAPEVSVNLAALTAQARIVHVIGTTGFSGEDEKKIRAAARHAVIVKSGNMSRAVAILAGLVERAAKLLPDSDIEILEMHHRNKADAPSGTALLLGEAAAKGRGIGLSNHSIRGRDGKTGPRPQDAIGFASLRGGSVVGTHDVIFSSTGERLVLSHIAEDRTTFARGAIAAALWGQEKKPGLYGMADVLGMTP
ncbi:MAG: 4-hydroxy-tetrahydrodipicolinate reductase [Alphaproteobacteria bacterium]|nr:4-hydroxy-tetrahydrodipicolinate reductase [Alphaproteobacteria bacterium]